MSRNPPERRDEAVATAVLVTSLPVVDGVLDQYAIALGHDFIAYRNHVHRVVNLCLAVTGGSRDHLDKDDLDKIAVAAAFHDLGIWTDHTFDYLAPSVRLASAWLAGHGKTGWTEEIAAMILSHHKITPYQEKNGWLVEPFRRADWIDVTRGALTLGAPRTFIAELYAQWPDAGFHRRLLQLELGHLRKHPLNPLPMFRL